MWDFLKSNSPDSSLRVNMLLITVPVSAILWMVAFHIFYLTIVPEQVTVMGHSDIKYIYRELPWLALSGFVGAIITTLVTLWVGKKINKEAENETPKPGDPPQPNKNT